MKNGARRSERLNVPVPEYDYIFFSEHLLVAASHVPPAFSQSAWVFAVVTSPAKAGPVTARAKARATIEKRTFMVFPPDPDSEGIRASKTPIGENGSSPPAAAAIGPGKFAALVCRWADASVPKPLRPQSY